MFFALCNILSFTLLQCKNSSPVSGEYYTIQDMSYIIHIPRQKPFFLQLLFLLSLANSLPTSPIQRTTDVAPTMTIQSLNGNGTVRKTSPPKVTISTLSLIHISEPTRRTPISYAVFC